MMRLERKKQRAVRPSDEELLKLLTDPDGTKGDLTPEDAARLRRRLAEEAEVAARFRRLEDAWRRLDPPPSLPAPAGFAHRVAARAAASGQSAAPPFVWRGAPVWARAAAALALLAGLLAGSQGARLVQPLVSPETAGEVPEEAFFEHGPSLAEDYLAALLETDSASTSDAPPQEDPR